MKVETYGHPENRVVRLSGRFGAAKLTEGYAGGQKCLDSVLLSRENAEELSDALSSYLNPPPVKSWNIQNGEAKPSDTSPPDRLDYISSLSPGVGSVWARTEEGALRRFAELASYRRGREEAELYDD